MKESTQNLIWWVFALPIFGFLIQALTGKLFIDGLSKRFGKIVMGMFACLPIFISFGLAAKITSELKSLPEESRTIIVTLFDWITIGGFSVPFEFRIDTLSMTMVLIITGIGALIHLFATGYMAEEKDYSRFFTYLNLFVAAMLSLVLGNNLLILFLGWEGVGVCSYLLIGFWYSNLDNSFAANKAFITNRIGDVGLTLGMFLLVVAPFGPGLAQGETRILSYDVLIPLLTNGANPPDETLMFWAVICLFIGAMGKSAQFPLYVWLPDAMAGPTPVSALIHAATMVTSGVFLLNRMSPIIEMSHAAMDVIAIVGLITAALGALIAFGQTDIKKVLAFSTVSQLGYMFIACGVGAYWVGLFHVITHAFFKALLFLGSGAVIYAMSHNQEMTNYGNLMKYLRITAVTMIIGWLAIAGFPFFAGFFSKEEILHAAQVSESGVGPIVMWGALIVALLTAAYMTRMTMMTFFSGEERWRLIPAHHGHDDHGHDHGHGHELAHAHAHADHGVHEDPHGFFMTDAEFAAAQALEEHEHHHDLDETHEPKEVPWMMWVPLVALAIASVFGGAWLLKGIKLEKWLESSVYVHHHEAKAAKSTGLIDILTYYLSQPLFWMSFAVFVIGVGWGYMTYRKGLPKWDGRDASQRAVFLKWGKDQFGVDRLFTQGSIFASGALGKVCKDGLEKLIDTIVVGVPSLVNAIGGQMKSIQSGFVRGYAVLMQLGIAAIIIYVVLMMANGGGN